ncbi:hypothetical protein WG66_002185 [Moniliophthora roreri]|nr:hypothetical protein WG66_002185 [Moniliophthora roreri]
MECGPQEQFAIANHETHNVHKKSKKVARGDIYWNGRKSEGIIHLSSIVFLTTAEQETNEDMSCKEE